MDKFTPVGSVYDDSKPLSQEQKRATVLFLFYLLVTTFSKENRKLKRLFIENYAKEIGIKTTDCLELEGLGFLSILKDLPDLQKEFLFLLVFEYANCNGIPSSHELSIITRYLNRLQFNENILLQTIYKHKKINDLIE
ncbi:hypothetical protein [Flavobacterium sp. TAB 87]|uniref:hypothetical protein n=1 Tax=Flavobacterium sp. TAB 87 TaxID=1729581 RepID=UPI00076CB67D|nr:hypothetical protein [Flavobacterium sp. TAB 87]KVV16405.1 hypothetical protein AP058_00045 [Flavobacterium sp. TAB 87]